MTVLVRRFSSPFIAALVVALAAPASSDAVAVNRLVTVDVGSGSVQVLATARTTYWGSGPCWRPDGAVRALVADPNRNTATYVSYSPAGRRTVDRAPEETLQSLLAPGCDRVAEVQYAFFDGSGGGVEVRDIGVTAPLARVRVSELPPVAQIAWSPQADRFAVHAYERRRGTTLRVFDAVTGRMQVRRRVDDSVELSRQAFSPDGSALTYTGGDGEIRILDFATGAVRLVTLPDDGEGWSRAAWSPRGDTIAAESGGAIGLIDIATGFGPRLPTARLDVGAFAWSPDGSMIAFSGERYVTHRRVARTLGVIAAVRGARPRILARGSKEMYTPPVWSPDGTRLATTDYR